MEIRPWRCGDETLAAAAAEYLSPASLANRFLVGTGGRLPAAYTRHISLGPRPTWDAQVAVGDGHLIGWAEVGRATPGSATADLGVIVADPWHRQGIASQMICALLPRCAAAGVVRLHADVRAGNRAAHGLLHSLFGGDLVTTVVDGEVSYEISLRWPLLGVPCPVGVLAGV
jgi:GNAT superfamily N-acetyltransferase